MKNKYDVMFDQSRGLYGELLLFYIRAIFYRRKLKKEKFKGIEADEELSRIYNGVFPYIVKMAHLGYENYKDFEEIDFDERTDYINKNKISSLIFWGQYYSYINKYIRVLLFLAIHDKDGIEFDLYSRSVILKIMNESELEEYIMDFFAEFSPESKIIFAKIMNDGFDFRKLTDDDIELLNNYHEKYMENHINPLVRNKINSKERVLKEAISFVGRG